MDESMRTYFQAIDEWAINYITQESVRLFKKQLTADQVRERYVSCVKTHASYEPLLKTKINMPELNPQPANIWTPDGQRDKLPQAGSWKFVEVKPRVLISNLWIMSQQFGLVLQLTDLIVRQEEASFPWAPDDEMLL